MIRIRKNIVDLNNNELRALKTAYRLLQEETTEEGYEALATIHGFPGETFCPHHTQDLRFLPWHRQYMLEFENALRHHVPDVTLPYWDWGQPPAFDTPGGLPSMCLSEIVDGNDVNPLSRAPMKWVSEFIEQNREQLTEQHIVFLGNGWSKRNPDPREFLHLETEWNLAAEEADAIVAEDFRSFSDGIEQPHDDLHGHVGWHMGSVATAAFDPIFWIHHSNVDRQWALWQLLHPFAEQHLSPQTLLKPFDGVTIRSTISIEQLGYDYADLSELRMLDNVEDRWVRLPQRFRDARERVSKERTFIVFDNLRMPMEDSVELRVFADQPDANAATAQLDNPNFLGKVFLFGMGGAKSAGLSPIIPFSRKLDVTSLIADEQVKLNVVPVNQHNEQIDVDAVLENKPKIIIRKKKK